MLLCAPPGMNLGQVRPGSWYGPHVATASTTAPDWPDLQWFCTTSCPGQALALSCAGQSTALVIYKKSSHSRDPLAGCVMWGMWGGNSQEAEQCEGQEGVQRHAGED